MRKAAGILSRTVHHHKGKHSLMCTSGFAGPLKSTHGPLHRAQVQNSRSRVHVCKGPRTHRAVCPRHLSDAFLSFLFEHRVVVPGRPRYGATFQGIFSSHPSGCRGPTNVGFPPPLELGKIWQNQACTPMVTTGWAECWRPALGGEYSCLVCRGPPLCLLSAGNTPVLFIIHLICSFLRTVN